MADGFRPVENAMRITKKLLRTAKKSMSTRAKELIHMTEDQLKSEVKRCFPSVTLDGTRNDLLWFMMSDLFDLAFPDHWMF